MWVQSKKTDIKEKGLKRDQPCWPLSLRLLASRIVRSKFLLFKLPSLWCPTLTNSHTHTHTHTHTHSQTLGQVAEPPHSVGEPSAKGSRVYLSSRRERMASWASYLPWGWAPRWKAPGSAASCLPREGSPALSEGTRRPWLWAQLWFSSEVVVWMWAQRWSRLLLAAQLWLLSWQRWCRWWWLGGGWLLSAWLSGL